MSPQGEHKSCPGPDRSTKATPFSPATCTLPCSSLIEISSLWAAPASWSCWNPQAELQGFPGSCPLQAMVMARLCVPLVFLFMISCP